ncbi:MAG TPA: TIGR02452 family protein [Phycisphaerae bacterium]|nr:TIGR02452 family protein [Phycisphaerae bacterium]HRW55461.1 TIGR02452 family protein [Phycisphaerae bacterium]
MNRNERRETAEQTVRIVREGGYVNRRGQQVDISAAVAAAVQGTRLIRPAELEELVARPAPAGARRTSIAVTNETTLFAARRLVETEKRQRALALNFASAKHPGGGFLGGSQAQEESLARSSALYECLLTAPDFYEINLRCSTPLYTDHMILSPEVPVFRDDSGTLLDDCYNVSFLTAPAVNRGVAMERGNIPSATIRETMDARVEKVLAVAATEGFAHLVLGAWGCGVFRNDPAEIATMFANRLGDGSRYCGQFETIVFAVLDTKPSEPIIGPFRRSLRAILTD